MVEDRELQEDVALLSLALSAPSRRFDDGAR
jgi:hypothetical protein